MKKPLNEAAIDRLRDAVVREREEILDALGARDIERLRRVPRDRLVHRLASVTQTLRKAA